MIYLFLIALFSYALMQSIETASFGSRVAGKLTGRLALGTTLQTSIFTMSRLFLPPLLLAMSYMIESELNIQLFLLMAMALVFLAFFLSLLVLFNLNFIQGLFQKLFFFYQSHSIPVAILKVLSGKQGLKDKVNLGYRLKLKRLSLKKILLSCFSYFFLSTGFLIAFSLAILIPEYRMTMSQLTTAFHGIGAVFLAMYIDPMMSRSLDVALQNNNWIDNVYSILIGRILSYLLASLMFFGIYLYTLLT
jgi:hypothetical protein